MKPQRRSALPPPPARVPAPAARLTVPSTPPPALFDATTEDGLLLTVIDGPTKQTYRGEDGLTYETDAGTLIDGVLVWGPTPPALLYLPAGGRRRDRVLVRVPDAITRQLRTTPAIRVFGQRVGARWAVERPGESVAVLDARGQVLDVACVRDQRLGEPLPSRPWHLLDEEAHFAHVAIWAQIYGTLAATPDERALAERVRTACSAVAELPHATFDGVRAHPALADLDLGPWRAWMSRGHQRTARTAASRAPR